MTYHDEEPYYEPTQADTILFEFTEKMQAVLTNTAKEKIAALEAQVAGLLKQKKEEAEIQRTLRNELSAIKQERINASVKFDAVKVKATALELIEEIIDVKTTHYVVPNWQGVKVYGVDDLTCDYSHHRRRALMLMFDNNGRPEWKLSSYSDGSGGSTDVIPCTSYEQALEKARQLIREKFEDSKVSRQTIVDANTFGVPVPPAYLMAVAEIDEKMHAERVKDAQKKLQSALDDAQKSKAEFETAPAAQGGAE